MKKAIEVATIPLTITKWTIQRQAERQEEILRVMCMLPGKYRYEQVNAAINASGISPYDIYESLAANKYTIALARFYEALQGPK